MALPRTSKSVKDMLRGNIVDVSGADWESITEKVEESEDADMALNSSAQL